MVCVFLILILCKAVVDKGFRNLGWLILFKEVSWDRGYSINFHDTILDDYNNYLVIILGGWGGGGGNGDQK